jgi:dipeptidyl-peptidase-4
MRSPDENQVGYDSASVFSYADRLEGNLLIIHGTSDDNVHVQNTMQLAERLQEQGKQYDMMLYPGKDHNVAGSGDTIALHLYTLITEFLLENL